MTLGREPADLFRHHRFARLFAAQKAAEMLWEAVNNDDVSPLHIRIEVPAYRPYDDLVITQSDGSIDGWQIKEQASSLARPAMEALFRGLETQPEVTRAHFAVQEPVSVSKVGALRHLRELTSRARAAAGEEPPDSFAGESSWLRFVSETLGSATAALSALRRLHVHFVGDPDQIRRNTLHALSAIFSAPLAPIADQLELLVSRIGAAIALTPERVEHELAQHLRLPPRTSKYSRMTKRARYLEGTGRRDQVPDPLTSVLGHALPPAALEKTRVPRFVSTKDGQRASLFQLLAAGAANRAVISGEVGSGKTTILAELRDTLRERALEDPEAPLPLLVRARDIIGRDPFEAAAPQLGLDVADMRALREDPRTAWVLLVDGADEHPAGWHRIEAVVNELADRCAAIIVTTRPTFLPLRLDYAITTLDRWTPAEVDQYLDRWALVDEETIRALRSSPYFEEVRVTLLSNPLLAALCVLVTRERGHAPRNRAHLYAEAVELLFQTWRRNRPEVPGQAWTTLAPSLYRLAHQHLVASAPIGPSSIRDLLRSAGVQAVPDAAAEIENLGLFVPDQRGGFEFMFRGLAEFLAAHELVQRPEGEVVELARHGWSEEVVRHLVGLVALRSGVTVSHRLIAAMAAEATNAEPAVDASFLRPFLVALRSARDLGDVPEPLATSVATAAAALVGNEVSSWIGERVSLEIAACAACDDAVFRAYLPRALAALAPTGEPQSWWAAQLAMKRASPLAGVFHRDASVRARSLEDIHFDGRDGIAELLVMSLFDNEADFQPFGVCPAIQAGLQLRSAERGPAFGQILEMLPHLARRHEQLLAGAAAVALLPTECDPTVLAKALRNLGVGFGVPAPVLDELALAPGGEAALEAEWPEWRKAREDSVARASGKRPPASVNTDTAPLSSVARAMHLRACRPALHRLPDATLAAVLAGGGYTRDIVTCEAVAAGSPELIRRVRLRGLPIAAQKVLASAAARFAEVRAALLQEWRADDEQKPSLDYPGVALEQLVTAGDEEAARLYARWLQCSLYNYPLRLPSPMTAVFEHPRVFDAAYEVVREFLHLAEHGRPDNDGQLVRVSRQSVATTLRYYWPVWHEDAVVIGAVLSWLTDSDDTGLLSALIAFDGVPAAAEALATVSTACERFVRKALAADSGYYGYQVQPCLWWLADHDGRTTLRSLFEEAARLHNEVGVTAAGLLIPVLNEDEAAALSTSVARVGVLVAESLDAQGPLAALVRAAPAAWAAAVEETLARQYFPDPALFMSVIPHLPSALQRTLAVFVHERAGRWELPWTSDHRRGAAGRPADLARRVLFDAGSALEPVRYG